MFKEKVNTLVFAALVADSYSLGAHWIYDEKQLQEAPIDWERLNAPMVAWHKGKEAGDFTHYGDQTVWLRAFLADKTTFDPEAYRAFWFEKMQHYAGYIDGASRTTVENIKNNVTPSGSASTDLSVVGRTTPLLGVSSTPEDFYANVEAFIKLTHNSPKALMAGDFFARLLVMVLEKKPIQEAMLSLKNSYSKDFWQKVEQGMESKDQETFAAIRAFGPACDVDEGFSGVVHLLCKYDNPKEMLIQNAKAGGDSSARGMIAAVIFMANSSLEQLPASWQEINAKL
ncbi:MAG: ADP-ribosylglycohydrolase family protein [Campylobacterales bacterium]|nr:ADP-ribosylglycohydrolase family protein [Campylobacterales bacterium]